MPGLITFVVGMGFGSAVYFAMTGEIFPAALMTGTAAGCGVLGIMWSIQQAARSTTGEQG